MLQFLPPGCSIYPDMLDQTWRFELLEAYGKDSSHAWRLYGQQRAAHLFIQLAWARAPVQTTLLFKSLALIGPKREEHLAP